MIRGIAEFLAFLVAVLLMHAVGAGSAVALVSVLQVLGLDEQGWAYVPVFAACIFAVYWTGRLAFRWMARLA